MPLPSHPTKSMLDYSGVFFSEREGVTEQNDYFLLEKQIAKQQGKVD